MDHVQAALGAFYGTRLEEHLRALDVDTVVVCGCNFPNCPRTTIYEASERGTEELRNIGVSLLRADECFP